MAGLALDVLWNYARFVPRTVATTEWHNLVFRRLMKARREELTDGKFCSDLKMNDH